MDSEADEAEQGLVDAWREAGLTEEEIATRLGMTAAQVEQWYGTRPATWLNRRT